MPGALNRHSHGALMFCTRAGDAPRQDFPPLGRKRAAQLGVFVVYMVNLVCAELAHALLSAPAFFLLYHY